RRGPGPEVVVAVRVLVGDGARGAGALLVDVGRAGDDVRVVGAAGELVGVRVGDADVVVARRSALRTRHGDRPPGGQPPDVLALDVRAGCRGRGLDRRSLAPPHGRVLRLDDGGVLVGGGVPGEPQPVDAEPALGGDVHLVHAAAEVERHGGAPVAAGPGGGTLDRAAVGGEPVGASARGRAGVAVGPV